MEKGNNVNVVDGENSSHSSKKPELQSANETVENKSAEKILSSDESSDDQSQSQVENIEGSLNHLPPEILMQILGNLDAPTLFQCRLVNRQFSSISTEILWSRREVKLEFKSEGENLMLVKKGKNLKKKSLQDFVECMKQSENCPFARFSFELSNSSVSQLDYFCAELDVTKIKSFKVSFSWEPARLSLSYLYFLVETLRDLLLKKIPHLEEFGLEMPYPLNPQQVNLFSSSSSIQLPHLKVLHLERYMVSSCPGIVGDLLTAAVNLEKIYSFSGDLFLLDVCDFGYFHSFGKIDCLQQTDIHLSPDFISEMKQNFPNLPNLLKLLTFKLFIPLELHETPQFWSDAAVFLSALFHSSKNTLKSLEMGLLTNLQFPRFTKLEKLSFQQVFHDSYDAENFRLFPPEIQSLGVFPVVRDLELNIMDWRVAFPEGNSIPRLPNVQRIQLTHRGEMAYQIEQVASICPNVKHLKITRGYGSRLNFLPVVRTIATHLPKLESLQLFINLDAPENDSHAIDSCFTGFSQENCKRLIHSALTKAQKKLVRDSNFDVKISESEFESEFMPEREFPSIFHMKNLKKLTVNPFSGHYAMKRKYFLDKLTWISKKYTLELMPQLEITETEDKSDQSARFDLI